MMASKTSKNAEHGVIHRFRMLLSLSVFLFVIGVVSIMVIFNLFHLENTLDFLAKEQATFARYYRATSDQILKETNAATRFSVAFNTDDLQTYTELTDASLHKNSVLMAFEDFLDLPGMNQFYGDFNTAYRALHDIQIHALTLILHAFEVASPVMPSMIRDYRLVSDELKWNHARKVKEARGLLFGEETAYLSQEVWGNLKKMNHAALQYYQEGRSRLHEKIDNRLVMLIVLMLALVLSVIISLRLKMTQFDARVKRKID